MTKHEKTTARIIEIMQQLEITAYRIVTFLSSTKPHHLYDNLMVYDAYDATYRSVDAYNGETRMLLKELELLVMREKS